MEVRKVGRTIPCGFLEVKLFCYHPRCVGTLPAFLGRYKTGDRGIVPEIASDRIELQPGLSCGWILLR